MWHIVYTAHAKKDAKKLLKANLKTKAKKLLQIIATDPLQTPPPYEKLLGDLDGAYSRRINIQHRIVYQIYPNIKTVKVIRMWTHYE
jgi:toxin YoeB